MNKKTIGKKNIDQYSVNLFGKKPELSLGTLDKTPKAVFDVKASGFDNWGENLILPDDIRQRIVNECTHKVVIKVCDTGAKFNHVDLTKGILQGSNYTWWSQDPDIQGHSTHVTGIIGGEKGGVCWDLINKGLINIKPVKILDDNGNGYFSWLSSAVSKERFEDSSLINSKTGVVYNFSLGGGTEKVLFVEEELRKSTGIGVVFVAATGNSSKSVEYPGNSVFTVATAALQKSLQLASFSNFGPEVTTAMPGVDILSTYPNNRYASFSGTSMATPFAAAAIAVAMSKWGMMNSNEVNKYLSKISTDLGAVGKDNLYGWGISYIKTILDVPPEGRTPPPPPVPVVPPPPPVPVAPPPPQWPKRILKLNFGVFNMKWKENSEKTVLISGSGGSNTLNTLNINNLILEIEFSDNVGKISEEIKKFLGNFFSKNYLSVKTPADFGTALKGVGYFLNVDLNQNFNGKFKINVIEISGGENNVFTKMLKEDILNL